MGGRDCRVKSKSLPDAAEWKCSPHETARDSSGREFCMIGRLGRRTSYVSRLVSGRGARAARGLRSVSGAIAVREVGGRWASGHGHSSECVPESRERAMECPRRPGFPHGDQTAPSPSARRLSSTHRVVVRSPFTIGQPCRTRAPRGFSERGCRHLKNSERVSRTYCACAHRSHHQQPTLAPPLSRSANVDAAQLTCIAP